jgi:hypothetical protein
MVELTETEARGWPAFRLAAGDVSLAVAPSIGGRIVSLTHRGEELLFAQPEHKGEVLDLEAVDDLRAFKRELGFRLWGGDKTWVSPQSEWWEDIPPLDLDAGRYELRLEDAAVEMSSEVCRETGLRIVRRIALHDDGEVVLDQALRNEGETEARRGIWDVTQCLRPFEVHLPVEQLRPYPEEGDSVALLPEVVSRDGGWAGVECSAPLHFKFGGLPGEGKLVALRRVGGETLAFARKFEADPSADYAHAAAVEIYNSPRYDYLEIEVHAPLQPIAPGGSVSHRQRWRIGSRAGNVGAAGAWDDLFASGSGDS